MTGLSPLLTLFQAGDVELDVRRLAARGGLMPHGRDDIALLALLTRDRDANVADIARASLARYPPPLVAEVGEELGLNLSALESAPATPPPTSEVPPRDDQSTAESVRSRILGMGVAERLVLALRGGRPERMVLAGDPAKAVALAVLSNPGLHEAEVESLARQAQVHEDLLRAIAGQRAWVRHYGVVVSLVRNARTPAAVSLLLLPRLQDRDLRLASTDRNIPDIVRVRARRKLLGG